MRVACEVRRSSQAPQVTNTHNAHTTHLAQLGDLALRDELACVAPHDHPAAVVLQACGALIRWGAAIIAVAVLPQLPTPRGSTMRRAHAHTLRK
jgi:hypothetical protein